MALAARACGAPQAGSGGTGGSEPKSGSTLNVRETVFYNNLDPTIGLRGEATFITQRAFDSLLTFKTAPELSYDELILTPNLAERWETSPDGKVFTFYLRKGVKF